MLYTLNVDEQTESTEDMVIILEEIISMINQGYTSGYNPNWNLDEEADGTE